MIRTLSVALMLTGTFVLMISLHNIDLAYNMDSGCIDVNYFNHYQTKQDGYLSGFQGILVSWFFFLSAFLLSSNDIHLNTRMRNN